MAKIRIYELAKQLGMSNKELLSKCDELGIEAKSHSSTVTDEQAQLIQAFLGNKDKNEFGSKQGEKIPTVSVPDQRISQTGQKPRKQAGPPRDPKTRQESSERPSGDRPGTPEVSAGVSAVAERGPERETIILRHGMTVAEFAVAAGKTPAQIVKMLMEMGEMKTANELLADDEVELLAEELGVAVRIVSPAEQDAEETAAEVAELVKSDLAVIRPPVVTVMGHVDHGKTSILDRIREAKVADSEAGGITQHIGAYQIKHGDSAITFIDTPGHEAFTAMRARGASVTDIVVLVVAADDGVMPQTVEAIDHARAAGVPIVVAVNKIDREDADPVRVRQQLAEHDLIPSEWGGEIEFVDVSAKAGLHIEDLIETIFLIAELEEFKGNPEVPALGVAIEAHLDKGRGPIVTVIVQQGTLRRGVAVVCGSAYGKVRAILDDSGAPMDEAGPSTPVQILGLDSVPEAGDRFDVVDGERTARHRALVRREKDRRVNQAPARSGLTLEQLFSSVQAGEVTELSLVLKADAQGSIEALSESLTKLSTSEVRVAIIHKAVGGITENDVRLAEASGGIIVGFNVRPDRKARAVAEKAGVEIRSYRVIYEAVDAVKNAMVGLLEPELHEKLLGQAEVRRVFHVPRIGKVAGCYVQEGRVTRNAKVRVVRDGVVVFESGVSSLKRFKEDVREVATGYECGIGVTNFQDLKEGDIIEAFEIEERAATL